MGFIILAIGIVVLWLWIRGRPLGVLGMFLALIFIFGPATQPSWSWSDPDDEGLIAFFLLIAIAPIGLRLICREMARYGGMMGWIAGNLVPPTKNPNRARQWSEGELDAHIQAWCDANAKTKPEDAAYGAEERQLRRGAELLGIDWQEMLRARAQSSSPPS
jgi:hypothetical protein